MYFSLISPTVGAERDAAQQRLDGPYADHQWLWNWFPSENDTRRDFLFRRREVDGLPRYYVVSSRAPVKAADSWHMQSRDYAPELAIGDQLQFELRANPTVRHGHDGKSKRHDVVMNAKKKLLAERGLTRWADWEGADRPSFDAVALPPCTAWLQRRGEALGFAPDLSTLTIEGQEQCRDQSRQDLRFTSVDLTGLITVTDPGAFRTALMSGVGSAKAFGCGLMLVKRPG